MVASLLVCVIPYWHEIAELCGEPVVEHLWVSTDKISTYEYIQDSGYEGELLSGCHVLRIIPSGTETINRVSHPFPVLIKLLVRRW